MEKVTGKKNESGRWNVQKFIFLFLDTYKQFSDFAGKPVQTATITISKNMVEWGKMNL